MKNAVIIILLCILSCLLCACAGTTEYTESKPSIDESFISESAVDEVSDEVSESVLSEDEYTEKYPFLKSEYIMTSKKKAGETVYICKFYFEKGVVTGAKLMTTFDDAETAGEYYDLVLEDYPDATLNRLTVTHYLSDDDVYFYGYSPEKLEFALENAGYEVSKDFDIDKFYDDLSKAGDEE